MKPAVAAGAVVRLINDIGGERPVAADYAVTNEEF